MTTAAYKTLRLQPNDAPVYAELAFDDPKHFPASATKPRESWKFTLKLLRDHGEFRAGDEVSYWVDNPKILSQLRGFRKNDRIEINYVKPENGPGHTSIKPIADGGMIALPAKAPETAPPAPNGAQPAQTPIRPRKTMEQALYEAYVAVLNTATKIAADDLEGADAFSREMMTGERLGQLATTIFIQG